MHTATPSYRTPWDEEPFLSDDPEPVLAIFYWQVKGDSPLTHFGTAAFRHPEEQDLDIELYHAESLLLIY